MSDVSETNCEQVAEALSLLATGDLPVGEQPVVREHVAQCSACRHRLSQVRAVARSLAGADPVWLDSASQAVTRRLAFEVGTQPDYLPSGGEHGPSSSGSRKRGVPLRRQRGWSWWAIGALAAAIVWAAMNGWWWASWKDNRPQPVVPEVIAEATTLPKEDGSEPKADERREFPTWWELQRSLAESDESFERTLARGHSATYSQTIELNRLLQELTQ